MITSERYIYIKADYFCYNIKNKHNLIEHRPEYIPKSRPDANHWHIIKLQFDKCIPMEENIETTSLEKKE